MSEREWPEILNSIAPRNRLARWLVSFATVIAASFILAAMAILMAGAAIAALVGSPAIAVFMARRATEGDAS